MNDPYYDGDFDEASQDGPIVVSADPESRGRIWTQTMVQRSALWAPLALDTEGPLFGDPPEPIGVLTEETRPTLVGVADLVRWERVFREVPAAHSVGVAYSYTYPKAVDGEITEATVATTVTMVNTYSLTADPSTIELIRKQKFADEAALVSYLGTISDYDLICADDSKIERAWGNIWRRKTPYVTKLTLLAAIA